MTDRALDLFRAAGQRVEDKTVFLDPEFVLEQVAKAPREFDVAARNPANTVHIGGDAMAFGAVYGPPFVREGDVRRDATMEDFRNFTKLAQILRRARLRGRRDLRAERRAARLAPPRHDLRVADADRQDLHGQRGLRGQRRATRSRMSEIVFGGRESIEQTPVSISLINCNSPLRWDDRMLDALFEYSAADQPVVLTPFLLMGAMSPVTIPAALVQQIAEALSGHRADPADPAGVPGDLRVVPVEHRHAVRLAVLRHPGVGDRPAVHRPDRPALRAAVPVRRRPDLQPGAGRAGRATRR